MAFAVVDTVIAGRYAPQTLAALSIGTSIYISVYVGLQEVIQALLPIWARLHGSQDAAALGHSVRQSVYIALGCTVIGVLLLAGASAPIMALAHVPADIRPTVHGYLLVQSLILPLALLARIFNTFCQSIGQPRWITGLQVATLAIKAPLSLWFAFGGWGLPAMGLIGCALATLVAQLAQISCMGYWAATQSPFTPYALLKALPAPHAPTLRQFLALGVPSSVGVWVEVCAFTIMGLLVAPMGVTASGAQQIGANMAAVLFMWPLSLAIATSARISYWHGANNAVMAQSALRTGLGIAVGSALLTSCALWWLRQPIAMLYTQDARVLALATMILGVIAFYHLADALQVMGLFALRCFKVVQLPTIIYTLSLWGVGIGGGYVLAQQPQWQSPHTYWLTSASAMALVALLFLVVLRQAERRYGH